MGSSTLYRLWTFAKATEKPALENFTTEALAAAIRSDPRPILRALAVPDGQRVVVSTQRYEKRCGYLDLVLGLGDREIWIEVKLWAGESGCQLATYQAVALAAAPARLIRVVQIGRTPLSNTVDFISWQELHRAIAELQDAGAWWHDLRLFLEENQMASDDHGPITQEEANAVAPAISLFPKLVRVLTLTTARCNALTKPPLVWPTDERKIRDQLLRRFAERDSISLEVRPERPALGIVIGARGADLAVWIWAEPGLLAERRQLLERLEKLDEPWEIEREATEWGLASCSRPLARFESQESAADWLVARVGGLGRVGVLERLVEWATGGP